MENATKALLIAAGIFICMMLISLLVNFRSSISSYFEQKHNLKMTEQIQKFNEEFGNYNGNEIRGNELISLMNRIIDYNNREANDKGYERIVIRVDLKNHANELAYDGNATLVTNKFNNKANDNKIKKIAEASISISNNSGIDDLKLQKLSSEIHNIVIENPTDEDKIERAKKLTKILGYTIQKDDNIDNIITATKEYYQLTQFKRVVFKCTKVGYDESTKRINDIRFETVEDNGILKLD